MVLPVSVISAVGTKGPDGTRTVVREARRSTEVIIFGLIATRKGVPLRPCGGGGIPADYVCYWHEKARAMIVEGQAKRVGLLATQGIRGGANPKVLDRIKESGEIFLAWSDEPWVIEGAAVHVSIIGYDDGSETARILNGKPATSINSDLTVGLDVTRARRLRANLGIAFMGDSKGGPFEISADEAQRLLLSPNPHGRPNSEVVKRWVNGLDVNGRPRNMWIIDFGTDMSLDEAALYEAPFEYVRHHIKPVRQASRTTTEAWWRHERPRVDMRRALAGLRRYIATVRHSKHRLFAWLPTDTLPDSALIVFARADDFFFGVLQSHVHEQWALAKDTQLESRPRYTPTTTFETFPLPQCQEPEKEAIATAARALDTFRHGWLNPPGASSEELASRTLTRLYNERPAWLAQAHERLDRAVHSAYGWPSPLPDEGVLTHLLKLNLVRPALGTPEAKPHTG